MNTKKTLQFFVISLALSCFASCIKNNEPTILTPSLKDTKTATKKPLKCILYIEANNVNIKNAGNYTLQKNGTPLFDIVNIFAANINYSSIKKKPVLYCNPNIREVLSRDKDYIRSLQRKGIKVVLTVLGNHQGVGFTNFTDKNSIKDFAQQISDTIINNNLDGVDLDEEWVNYGKNNTAVQNDSSLILLVKELRNKLPGKIISIYNVRDIRIGIREWMGQKIGNYIDYATNAYYGSYENPNYPGLGILQEAGASIQLSQTNKNIIRKLCDSTLKNGNGIFLCYDLKPNVNMAYLTQIADLLYKDSIKQPVDNPFTWTNLGEDKDWQTSSGIR